VRPSITVVRPKPVCANRRHPFWFGHASREAWLATVPDAGLSGRLGRLGRLSPPCGPMGFDVITTADAAGLPADAVGGIDAFSGSVLTGIPRRLQTSDAATRIRRLCVRDGPQPPTQSNVAVHRLLPGGMGILASHPDCSPMRGLGSRRIKGEVPLRLPGAEVRRSSKAPAEVEKTSWHWLRDNSAGRRLQLSRSRSGRLPKTRREKSYPARHIKKNRRRRAWSLPATSADPKVLTESSRR